MLRLTLAALALAALALLLPLSALAAGCERPTPLRFAPGSVGAVVEGGVPRGAPDCWTLNARAGQLMEARITSTENNAVLSLYPPGWRLRRDRSGNTEVEGKAMTAPDSTGTRVTLPSSGDYLLVIGTTRGGADYRLGVAIR
jgi:hypothetical protein